MQKQYTTSTKQVKEGAYRTMRHVQGATIDTGFIFAMHRARRCPELMFWSIQKEHGIAWDMAEANRKIGM